jgi:hypothetical protein
MFSAENLACFDNPLTSQSASDRYTFRMRRLLAITLLIAFFAPSAASALTAIAIDSEAGLPPCCRSHGAHHCEMRHWMLRQADSRAPLAAPAPCPFYPVAATAPQTVSFALGTAPQFATRFHRAAAPQADSRRAAHRFAISVLTTRGPPDLRA